MEKDIYHKTAAMENVHWWFIGRRFIVEQILKRLGLPINAEILEVGCGTGGNLPLLAKFGNVYGVEIDDTARAYATERGIGTILPGSLPDEIPFPEQRFDLIVMTDVLEHVTEDQEALERLYTRLTSGGYILITVPAFPALWSRHDDLHHHKRRYTRERLRAIVTHAGFRMVKASYINCIMFPAIAGVRLMQRFLGMADADDLKMYPPFMNRLLAGLFAGEGHLLGLVSLPFGLSLLCVGRKGE
jgi:SAM-dependent methyltransferase